MCTVLQDDTLYNSSQRVIFGKLYEIITIFLEMFHMGILLPSPYLPAHRLVKVSVPREKLNEIVTLFLEMFHLEIQLFLHHTSLHTGLWRYQKTVARKIQLPDSHSSPVRRADVFEPCWAFEYDPGIATISPVTGADAFDEPVSHALIHVGRLSKIHAVIQSLP